MRYVTRFDKHLWYRELVFEMKVIKLTPAEKAAITGKWRLANLKAQATARNAKLLHEVRTWQRR
jgi:hypothetical protein